mgnify:CR=1 FL=1
MRCTRHVLQPWDVGARIHQRSLVPRLKPVGPWGFGAHTKRIELIVATAALMGCDFSRTIYIAGDEFFDPCQKAPDWYVAWDFLQENDLEVTETLQVVRIGHPDD